MRIAIPANEKNIDSLVNACFSRCAYFCFYNTKNRKIDFRVNTINDGGDGLGPLVTEFLANNGIKKIVAPGVGPKAKEILESLDIEVEIVSKGLMIRQIIEMLNN